MGSAFSLRPPVQPFARCPRLADGGPWPNPRFVSLQAGTRAPGDTLRPRTVIHAVSGEEADVGKGILLWLLGIPLPIIIILLLIWH